jgi:hypothetical protein
MATTISTLDAVLKNFYAKAVVEQLNQEVLALEMFEKAKLDWSGKKVVVPVHLARNSGVDFKPEGGALPTAGQQGYAELNVFAKFLYGRFQLSGPSISSAKGAYSFGNYVDLELRKLVEDVRNRANLATIHGAAVKGYTTFSGTLAAGGVGSTATVPYSGNVQQIADIIAGLAAGTSLRCRFINTNTYAYVKVPLASLATEITVTSANVQANTLLLTNVAGGSAIDTTKATVTDMVGKPFALQFFIVNDGAATLVNDFSGGGSAPTPEFTGIVHNLNSGGASTAAFYQLSAVASAHFGIDRSPSGTVVGRDKLRVPATLSISTSTVDADYNVFQALSLGRMQSVIDAITTASGKEADVILCNPSLRQSYTSLLVGTTAGNILKPVDGPSNGDGGFKMGGLGFNGVPIKTSKDCGKAIMLFLYTKAWHLAELEKSGFADLDGAILARAGVGAAGVDAYEGYYRMYADIYCDEPNANGVLTQISFV